MSHLGMTLGEVRDLLGHGELMGCPDFICESISSLSAAGSDAISFVRDERYFGAALTSEAGALLVPSAIAGTSAHQLVVSDPTQDFGRLLHTVAMIKRREPPGIHAGAHVHPTARLGKGIRIGPGAVVSEGAEIGDRSVISGGAFLGRRSVVGADSVLHPNVVVMEDVSIGDRVTIHGGAVLGADGYGYMQSGDRHIKVPQVGAVVIEDDVEIGALATIDRATMDTTRVRRGTKIGDLCHVAHNCDVGEDVLLLPGSGLSGSVKVGRGAMLAARAGVSDNLTVGEGAVLGATAAAYEDVPPGARVWGNPARDLATEKRVQAHLTRLPRMAADLRALEKSQET